jgi:hypothetical protein
MPATRAARVASRLPAGTLRVTDGGDGGEAAEFDLGLAEAGAVLGDHEVAGERQLLPFSQAVAVDGSDGDRVEVPQPADRRVQGLQHGSGHPHRWK